MIYHLDIYPSIYATLHISPVPRAALLITEATAPYRRYHHSPVPSPYKPVRWRQQRSKMPYIELTLLFSISRTNPPVGVRRGFGFFSLFAHSFWRSGSVSTFLGLSQSGLSRARVRIYESFFSSFFLLLLLDLKFHANRFYLVLFSPVNIWPEESPAMTVSLSLAMNRQAGSDL